MDFSPILIVTYTVDGCIATDTCGLVTVPCGIETIGCGEIMPVPNGSYPLIATGYPPGGTMTASVSCNYCSTEPISSGDSGLQVTMSDADVLTVTYTYTVRGCTSTRTCELRGVRTDTDPDSDGWSDFDETIWGSDPGDPDSAPDPLIDRDWDGLSDVKELLTHHTDPDLFDTDGDGAGDLAEVELEMDPRLWDSQVAGEPDGLSPLFAANDLDGDLLYDEYELERGWSPTDGDMDADGVLDGWEWKSNVDPSDGGQLPDPAVDSDGDSIPDLEERFEHFTDPSSADSDGDGLTDGWELTNGYHPRHEDSDGNGTVDGYEDPDGDGLTNFDEIANGTGPRAWDSDGDNTSDGDELAQQSDPLDSADDGLPLDPRLLVPVDMVLAYFATELDGTLYGSTYELRVGPYLLNPTTAPPDSSEVAALYHGGGYYRTFRQIYLRTGRTYPIYVRFFGHVPYPNHHRCWFDYYCEPPRPSRPATLADYCDPPECGDCNFSFPIHWGGAAVVPTAAPTQFCPTTIAFDWSMAGDAALLNYLRWDDLRVNRGECLSRLDYDGPRLDYDGLWLRQWSPRDCCPCHEDLDDSDCGCEYFAGVCCDPVDGKTAYLHLASGGSLSAVNCPNGEAGVFAPEGHTVSVVANFPLFSASELWFTVDNPLGDPVHAKLLDGDSEVDAMQLTSNPSTLTVIGKAPLGGTDLHARLHGPYGPIITSIRIWNGVVSPSDEDAELAGSATRVVELNNGDPDGDAIPGFADGLDIGEAPEDDESPHGRSTLMALALDLDATDPESIYISFDYDGSDPTAITVTTDPDTGLRTYSLPADGSLRLWRKPASEPRDVRPILAGGDYIPPNVEVGIVELDVTEDGAPAVWIEAVRPSEAIGDLPITISICGSVAQELDVTAFGTQHVQIVPSDLADPAAFLPIQGIPLSHPTPVIELTQPFSVSNVAVHTADGDSRLVADLHLSGTVDDAASDLTNDAEAAISILGVLVNGRLVHQDGTPVVDPPIEDAADLAASGLTPKTVPVQYPPKTATDELLKPYDFNGTFSTIGVLEDVEVQPGLNTLRLTATNLYGNAGYLEVSFEIDVQPPPDETVQVDFYLPVDDPTVAPSQQPDPPPSLTVVDVGGAGTIMSLTNMTFVSSGLGAGEAIWQGIAGDGQPRTVRISNAGPFDPASLDIFVISITDPLLPDGEITLLLQENAIAGFSFSGEETIESQERTTYKDFALSVNDETLHSFASHGGAFAPFLTEFLGPPDLFDSVVIEHRQYGLLPELVDGESRLFVRSENLDLPLVMLALDTPTGEPLLIDRELLEMAPREWTMPPDFEREYMIGCILGLKDGGISVLDSLNQLRIDTGEFIGNGAVEIWCRFERSVFGEEPFVYQHEKEEWAEWFVETDELVQDMPEMAADMYEQMEPVIVMITQSPDDFYNAVVLHDSEALDRLGELHGPTMMYLAEFLSDSYIEMQYWANDHPREAGRIIGKMAGMAISEVIVGTVSTGGANVAKESLRGLAQAGKMARAADKIEDALDAIVPDPELASRIRPKVTKLQELVAALRTTRMCFVAGTPVHVSGGLAAIETLRVGDYVLARDEATGEIAYKRVAGTVVTHPDHLYRLTVQAAAGKKDTIVGTGEHPFWVVGAGEFVPMAQLRVGDVLLLADGTSTAYVTDIQVQRGPPAAGSAAVAYGWDGESYTTYNIEVEDYHTYFVGAAGAWVHNQGTAACQRAFAIIAKIKDENPGISHWDAFVEALSRTNTALRRKAFDPVLPEVTQAVMEAMYRDAILPDGAVDLTKVKAVREIREFRGTTNGQRLATQLTDLHNHHSVPKEWAKVLYKMVHGTDPTPEWLDDMPGLLVDVHQHIRTTAGRNGGIDSFHNILDDLMDASRRRGALTKGDIFDNLEDAYESWDPEHGPDYWAVAKQWLADQGITE